MNFSLNAGELQMSFGAPPGNPSGERVTIVEELVTTRAARPCARSFM